jgi:hypothetical protein
MESWVLPFFAELEGRQTFTHTDIARAIAGHPARSVSE